MSSRAVGGDRDDHAAAVGKLGDQRRRRRWGGGVDGDRVEGGCAGQAEAAVADDQLDVGDAERVEDLGRGARAAAAWRSTLTTSAASARAPRWSSPSRFPPPAPARCRSAPAPGRSWRRSRAGRSSVPHRSAGPSRRRRGGASAAARTPRAPRPSPTRSSSMPLAAAAAPPSGRGERRSRPSPKSPRGPRRSRSERPPDAGAESGGAHPAGRGRQGRDLELVIAVEKPRLKPSTAAVPSDSSSSAEPQRRTRRNPSRGARRRCAGRTGRREAEETERMPHLAEREKGIDPKPIRDAVHSSAAPSRALPVAGGRP